MCACVLTKLVAIATDLDVCAFHNYHVMTDLNCLICDVLNSPCTLAHLHCIVSTHTV